jgi:hypothetical protein
MVSGMAPICKILPVSNAAPNTERKRLKFELANFRLLFTIVCLLRAVASVCADIGFPLGE